MVVQEKLPQTLQIKTTGRATVCSDRLDMLNAAWSILRTLTSVFLKQLRNVVVSLLWSIVALGSYKAVNQVAI